MLVAFDCDGVLLDTNSEKVNIFRDALSSLLEDEQHILRCCAVFKQLYGKTRPIIFSGIMDLFEQLEYANPQKLVNQLLSEYSQGVSSLYESADLIDENVRFLKKAGETRRVSVVSSSDQQQLRDSLPKIIPDVGVTLILGGPCRKDEHLKNLALDFGTIDLFVGDSISDAKVALDLEINFFAVTKYSLHPRKLINFCLKNSLPFAKTLEDFPTNGIECL